MRQSPQTCSRIYLYKGGRGEKEIKSLRESAELFEVCVYVSPVGCMCVHILKEGKHKVHVST